MDIILLSAHTGEVIQNLTSGFDQDFGFEYIPMPGLRFNTVPWISWAPSGDHLAYFVRKGKYKSLVIQNVLTRKVEQLIDLDMVEPEAPDFSPNGDKVLFSALRGAVGDIFEIDLATEEVTNITEDDFANYSPVYSPDASFIVFAARVSGNNKLFKLDRATGKRTQLTFGTFDEPAPSSSTTGPSSSRRPLSIRPSRSTRRWPVTGRSTTSGRSIWRNGRAPPVHGHGDR